MKPQNLITAAATLALALSAQGAVTLAHHYTFDTNGSDSAGSINGVLQGAATITTGMIGNAVSLAGGTDHVLMANPGTPVIPVSTSYSVSLWAKRNAFVTPPGDPTVTGREEWMFGQGDTGSPNQSLHVGFRANNQTAHAVWGDDLQWFPTQATDTGVWHQWVVTYDAATDEQFMYVDGGGAGNSVNRTTNNGDFLGSGTNDFWVGKRRDGRNFDGLIDDVQIYSGVLSASEVATLFSSPGTTIPEPSTTLLISVLGLGLAARRRR